MDDEVSSQDDYPDGPTEHDIEGQGRRVVRWALAGPVRLPSCQDRHERDQKYRESQNQCDPDYPQGCHRQAADEGRGPATRGLVCAGYRLYRAEAGNGGIDRLGFGQPGREASGHRLAEVIFCLGENPAGLVRAGGEAASQQSQVFLELHT